MEKLTITFNEEYLLCFYFLLTGILIGIVIGALYIYKNNDKALEYLKEQSFLRESELARAKERIQNSYYPKKEAIEYGKFLLLELECNNELGVHATDNQLWEAYQKSKSN